ncbi:hypothetical protein G6011_07457 [Alternaria panax]|uniref:F-box domain-containing protein n=1 Tax=Alternaria panax TaxID=48097 RepID=A0AAD4FET8_9PLEO|nr:hypothetical protein G6011_07457 [Alternaria panax]
MSPQTPSPEGTFVFANIRTGSKRAGGKATDTARPTKKAKGSVKKVKKAVKSEEPTKEAQQYFRFLDLSPELRNRVYEHATEDDSEHFAPQPVRYGSRLRRKPHAERTWQFFGLTQACIQFRAEYRPLWLRDLRVGFKEPSALITFDNTFLNHGSESKYMPKLVQILWNHGEDDQSRFVMSPLLRLHALSMSSRVEFVPLSVATGQSVHDDMCHQCLRQYEREKHGLPPDSDNEDCSCPDFDLDQEEWEDFKNVQMAYTSELSKLIHNKNEAWIKVVQENKATISCTFCLWTHHAIIEILYKDAVCQAVTDSQPAWDLLKEWGIPNLPTKRETDFVFAYKANESMVKDGYRVSHSVSRQIIFHKLPSVT